MIIHKNKLKLIIKENTDDLKIVMKKNKKLETNNLIIQKII